MSKHTPGPWTYARDFDENGNRPKVTTIAVCCNFVIGLPAAYEGGNYRDGDPCGDPEADARLIAAAPVLLKALKDLREAIKSRGVISTVKALSQTDVAVAAAEGGAA